LTLDTGDIIPSPTIAPMDVQAFTKFVIERLTEAHPTFSQQRTLHWRQLQPQGASFRPTHALKMDIYSVPTTLNVVSIESLLRDPRVSERYLNATLSEIQMNRDVNPVMCCAEFGFGSYLVTFFSMICP
jgi:hypothetical protein